MARTVAVYSFPAVARRRVLAPAGRPARGRPGLDLGARARARPGAGAHACPPDLASAFRRRSRPCGSRSTRPRPTTSRASSCRSPSVGRRPQRLFQRRHAVLRRRAAEDARSRHPRDLRLLPSARARSGCTTAAHRSAGGGGRRGLAGNAVSVAQHRLRRGDPRRRALGSRGTALERGP